MLFQESQRKNNPPKKNQKKTKDEEYDICKYNTTEKEDSFFIKNGGRVLQKLITTSNGYCNSIRMFTKKELDKATNSYHIDGVLQRDWNYILYKVTHGDQDIYFSEKVWKI